MLEQIGIQEKPINDLLKKIKGFKKLIKEEQGFQPLIPFTLKGGFVDITGQGIANETTEIQDATTFKRVFTGQSTVIAQWDNSVKLKNDGAGSITREFQKGDVHYAIGYRMNSTAEISDYTQETSFKELHDIESVQVIVPADSFKEGSHYKAFMLPRLSERLLRITAITRYHTTNGEYVYAELTLSSINDQLSKTGIAISNYIQRGGIGEPYAHPVWDNENHTLTHIVRGIKGVNGVQIELIGNLAISSMMCIGRKYEEGKVNPPKPLLLHKTLPEVPTPLVKAGSPVRNLRFLRDCQFSLVSGWADWKEAIKNQYDMTQQKWFQGGLQYNLTESDKETFQNNPVDIEKSYKLGLGIDLKEFGSPMINENFGNLAIGDTTNLANLLSLNAIKQLTLTQLSASATEHMPISARSIPVVGRILSGLTLGIPLGADRTKAVVKGTKFDAFMHNETYELLSKTKYPTKGLMEANEFDNTNTNPVGNAFGSKANRIALRFSLTDKFSINYRGNANIPVETVDTETLGGANQWDHKSRTQDTTDSFEIDKFVTHIFGKGEYIVSYFKDDTKQYTSRFITTSNFLDDIKQFGNEIVQGSMSNLPIEGGMDGITWPKFEKLGTIVTKPIEIKVEANRPVYMHELTVDKYTQVELTRGNEQVSGSTNIVKNGATDIQYDVQFVKYNNTNWGSSVHLRITKEGEYYKFVFDDGLLPVIERPDNFVIARLFN